LLVDRLEVGMASTKRVKVDTAKCPVDREKWKTAGWYKLNEFSIDGNTYIVGSFGYWKGSDNNAQKVEWKKEWTDKLTPEQRQAMADANKANIKKAEEERKREIEHCANQAQTNWIKLKTTGESGYLAKKQVGAFSIKYHPKKDMIVVPVQDSKGKLFALQLIRHGLKEGSKIPAKQFWPRGAEIKGHFHVIGTLAGAKTIFIAEGYATGASIHMATGIPVVVAFNANNLTPVTKAIAAAHKYAQIVICADDDYLTDVNPGVTQAQNAALSVGGAWVKPDFVVAGTDIRNGEKLTDFNDLHTHPQGGLHLVTAQLAQYIGQAQPQPKTATVAGADKQGEGERKPAVSVMSVDEIVERFTYIDDDSGEYCFDNWERRIVRIKKAQSLLPNDVRWDRVKGHLNWQKNAVYKDQIGFDPTGKDENIKRNRWRGWPSIPANHECPVDHCEKLLGLLFELCSVALNKPMSGEKDVYKWVLQWLAYPIQHPGEKLDTALIFHGPQGTGKNLFFNAYGSIYDGESENRKHFSLITQDTMEDQREFIQLSAIAL
jgi:putative DNA primase/helicase